MVVEERHDEEDKSEQQRPREIEVIEISDAERADDDEIITFPQPFDIIEIMDDDDTNQMPENEQENGWNGENDQNDQNDQMSGQANIQANVWVPDSLPAIDDHSPEPVDLSFINWDEDIYDINPNPNQNPTVHPLMRNAATADMDIDSEDEPMAVSAARRAHGGEEAAGVQQPEDQSENLLAEPDSEGEPMMDSASKRAVSGEASSRQLTAEADEDVDTDEDDPPPPRRRAAKVAPKARRGRKRKYRAQQAQRQQEGEESALDTVECGEEEANDTIVVG